MDSELPMQNMDVFVEKNILAFGMRCCLLRNISADLAHDISDGRQVGEELCIHACVASDADFLAAVKSTGNNIVCSFSMLNEAT